jgi:hypothetical protein
MTDWYADKIQQKSVDALIPYDRNPNIHPDSQIDQLVNSVKEWGWTVPILIDENDMVLAGHGRLFAAKKLDMDTVPCIVAEGWSEEQKKAYIIADNKLSESSQWDDALYFSELRSIDKMGFDLATIGLDPNFDFDSFSPNLDPSFTYSGVDDADIDKARSKMDSQIGGLSEEKADRGVEVMCPHCAETFTVSGY